MARTQSTLRARRTRTTQGPVWDVTTLGGHPDRPRRPRLGLGGALAAGLAVLVVYVVLSLLAHLFLAALLWLPAIVLAGLAVRAVGRTRLPAGAGLVVGLVVLVAVRTLLGRI